jgi:hypothetical protein
MPRPPSDQSIFGIPGHGADLPPEAATPLRHYERNANDVWNLVLYLERNLKDAPIYQAAFNRHMHRLYSMLLVRLVGAFELYIKETAALCVDRLAEIVTDDRLSLFKVPGNVIAAQFKEPSLGKALCETET